MTKLLLSTMEKLTPQELAEVESFAAYLVSRRKLKDVTVLTDDISTKELTALVESGGSFDWLSSPEEDLYSSSDGVPVRW